MEFAESLHEQLHRESRWPFIFNGSGIAYMQRKEEDSSTQGAWHNTADIDDVVWSH